MEYKSEIFKKITEYINENFTDPSLCPDKLATITGYSTHYIRDIFKEKKE